jgi:exodeoxyribonuclease V beta subunit
VAVLTADYQTPDQLLASVNFSAANVDVFPIDVDLDAALAYLQQFADCAKAALDETARGLQAHFPTNKFKPSYAASFEFYLKQLSDWLQNKSAECPDREAFELLTHQGLLDGLNGIQFKTNKTHSSEARKQDYLAELAINVAPFDDLAKAIKNISLVLRKSLIDVLQTELDKRLQQLNVMSFDHLIIRLNEALISDKDELLANELRRRFAAALIDEFQDTDASQWSIFSKVFAHPDQYLYLIGDPKQAIYKFRGADIYAYLSAQKQAQQHFTLDKNWRSHPQLVDAVNMLFARERAFLLEDLSFHSVKPAKSLSDGQLCQASLAVAPMVLWQLPESDSKTGFWTAGKAAEHIKLAVVNECVALLNQDNDQIYRLQPANSPLQAKDIAILVRTNGQAREYQAALRAAGVVAVLNSMESVFASQEAFDLHVVLQAVASPGDNMLLKQALALDWFGLDGIAMYELGNDETALDVWMSRFLGYFQLWQQAGVMTMMQRLLAQENVRPMMATERRIGNLDHVLELLQQAAMDEHLGINKTLDWLRRAIVKADNSADQQLRLESDEDAVNIVTMHRAKGLEYPVVFCPYLWQHDDRLVSEKELIVCHEQGRMVVDLGSEAFERRRVQAMTEQLAEDLRVFYVAVTRAKYRCYIVWADVRSEKQANNSAMAWLLEFAEDGFSDQQAKLQALESQDSAAFCYQLLELSEQINAVNSPRLSLSSLKLRPRKRQRSLFSHWQMSSYTALSALSIHDAPELPTDKVGEQQSDMLEMVETATLPSGTHTGNVVHELLELNDFADFADLAQRTVIERERICQRYGLRLEQPELLDALLQAVVSTPLSSDTDFCLMNLPLADCIKEMPFYLAMQTLDTNQINAILQPSQAYQSLTAKQMSGYLTGFIDLVCVYQGRYYLMDYKTNTLPYYRQESLVEAMREHNYGLQYWLYSVVLHRYLQNRLPDYYYESHFGGVRYLFVRGMQPELPLSGVYQDRPDAASVEALAALFGASV